MEINITAFGIAKDIVKAREIKFTIAESDNIGQLKRKLISAYPDFEEIASLSFAVGEEYQPDDYQLKAGDHVVIIPPVSGG